MRIAIVGPAHPYKGGITQHTTELAHHLAAAGHQVELLSWRAQWPFFYPGQQFVPDGQPEVPLYPATKRVLSWKNPTGWQRWGRYLRRFDRLIFIWWVPTIQGPIYLTMLRALGRRLPPVTIICHNVLPHEPRLGDKRLARAVLRRAARVIVHTPAQAAVAGQLATAPVTTVALPLLLTGTRSSSDISAAAVKHQLLFFGIIRPYKGVDILLRALVQVPDVKLTIAGEFWGGAEPYVQLIKELGLADRVTVQSGYVAAGAVVQLFGNTDALVLPYKEGTASSNVSLAHSYGVPVIATTAGSLASQVNDGVDGLLCAPNDTASLAGALQHFYEPGVAARLQASVPAVAGQAGWSAYVAAITDH